MNSARLHDFFLTCGLLLTSFGLFSFYLFSAVESNVWTMISSTMILLGLISIALSYGAILDSLREIGIENDTLIVGNRKFTIREIEQIKIQKYYSFLPLMKEKVYRIQIKINKQKPKTAYDLYWLSRFDSGDLLIDANAFAFSDWLKVKKKISKINPSVKIEEFV